jgi:putative hydrolase of the HAD superfamily
MPGAKIKAVFFDAGGTLFQPHPSVGEIYARVALRYGMDVDPRAVEEIFREEFSRRDKQVSGAHAAEKMEKEWWRSLVLEVFTRVTEVKNFGPFYEELYDLFARAEAWRLYPEVPAVLEGVRRRGLRTGIVSNWDSRLQSICEGMRLLDQFDFILASAVVGSAKPDRGIFLEALRRSGARPEEALHVGDSVENDFRGATRAGLRAVVVLRQGTPAEGVPTIRSLEEIFTWLE